MNVNSIASPFVHSTQKRRKNVWYSIKDGNWNDPNTWESNALSFNQNNFNYPGQAIPTPVFPAIGDDVYIYHSVTVNVYNVVIPINNLFVSAAGTLLVGNGNTVNLTLSGNVQCEGTINLTSPQIINFFVSGTNNYINTFICGTNSNFGYVNANYNQYVLDLTYSSLYIAGRGTKYLQVNTTLGKNLQVDPGAIFDIGVYDLTVTGITTLNVSTILKQSAGSLIFIGKLTNVGEGGTLDFSGNPTVECRGGVTFNNMNFTSGTGAWNFTTNNQTLIFYNRAFQFNGPVSVVGAITVTNGGGSVNLNFGMQINNSLNGTVAGSTFSNNTNSLILNTSSKI